jgi:hypothetical protein
MAETVFKGAGLNFCPTRAGGCGIVTLRSRGLNGVLGVRCGMLIGLLISRLLAFRRHGSILSGFDFYWRPR